MTGDEAEKVVFPFGKYRGKTCGWVFSMDPGYFKWFADNVTIRNPAMGAITDAVETIRHPDKDVVLDIEINRAHFTVSSCEECPFYETEEGDCSHPKGPVMLYEDDRGLECAGDFVTRKFPTGCPLLRKHKKHRPKAGGAARTSGVFFNKRRDRTAGYGFT